MADYKNADLNQDGTVTPKERRKYKRTKAQVEAAAAAKPNGYEPPKDKLQAAELEKQFGFAKDIVWTNPELRKLWQDAIREDYTDEMFQSQLRSTKWYQENSSFARKAWAAEKAGGADWETQLQDAQTKLQQRATQLGASLAPETVTAMSRRYLFEGWDDPNRQNLMDEALSGMIGSKNGYLSGQSGDFQQRLMETARRNGITMSPGWYQSAAQSVATDLTTESDWERELRQASASKWPTYSDRILSGIDMQDLASGYINTMAQVFETDPAVISLDDPFIKSALQGIDPESGQPTPESLWDFEYRLKSDPRWTNTKQGANKVANVGMDVLRLMGFQS